MLVLDHGVARNIQQLAPGIWMAETQGGQKGKGKLWRPAVLHVHPHAGTEWYNGRIHAEYDPFGEVKPALNQYRHGQSKATLWFERSYVEAYFPTEEQAISFLILNAKEFLP